MTVVKLDVHDKEGVLSNINDFLDLYRKNDVESVAISFTKKDKVTYTFWFGEWLEVIGLLELQKSDILKTSTITSMEIND